VGVGAGGRRLGIALAIIAIVLIQLGKTVA
jgi:hypothetical protein